MFYFDFSIVSRYSIAILAYKKDVEGPSLQLKNSYNRTFIADIRNI